MDENKHLITMVKTCIQWCLLPHTSAQLHTISQSHLSDPCDLRGKLFDGLLWVAITCFSITDTHTHTNRQSICLSEFKTCLFLVPKWFSNLSVLYLYLCHERIYAITVKYFHDKPYWLSVKKKKKSQASTQVFKLCH